jgi:hypothetical protein
MLNQSTADVGLVVGSMIDVVAGKYKGHRGSIVRFTAKRVVVRLVRDVANGAVPTRNREVTISPDSVSIRRGADSAFFINDDLYNTESDATELELIARLLVLTVSRHRNPAAVLIRVLQSIED